MNSHRKSIWTVIIFLLVIGVLPMIFPPLRTIPRYIELMMEKPPDSLPVPVRGVKPSQLTDTWGAPRSGGRRHEGIDIFAKRNTPILSTTHGVVTRVGENNLGGLIIMITGPGGDRHYYAHLHRHTDHKVGDWVERGEVIGYVGTTGNARGTPPHLHYGIYRFGGGAINPYPLLTGKRGRESRQPV